MAEPVWFWQRMVSPHMAGLAAALAASGRDVTFVAEQTMSADREAQGWSAPDLGEAQLRFAPTVDAAKALAHAAPSQSIHVCQGFRANGVVGSAQTALAKRGLRQWVIMETVDDHGWHGPLKRLVYRLLIWKWRSKLAGILATGDATAVWLSDRGMPATRIFPFAYFLPEPLTRLPSEQSPTIRFLFVGRLVELKRLDLLIDALSSLHDPLFELTVVGDGPLETSLRSLADTMLPGRVRWLGARPIGEIPALMEQADCLVLPSRYDGWGAVVSEALMAGTPAICSDTVGAAGVVRASGNGAVFPAGDTQALAKCLGHVLSKGRHTAAERTRLAAWGRCLGAQEGSRYLDAILWHAAGRAGRPVAPWLDASRADSIANSS